MKDHETDFLEAAFDIYTVYIEDMMENK